MKTRRFLGLLSFSRSRILVPIWGTMASPVAPRYYDWKATYPYLSVLIDNIADLKYEASKINGWVP